MSASEKLASDVLGGPTDLPPPPPRPTLPRPYPPLPRPSRVARFVPLTPERTEGRILRAGTRQSRMDSSMSCTVLYCVYFTTTAYDGRLVLMFVCFCVRQSSVITRAPIVPTRLLADPDELDHQLQALQVGWPARRLQVG